MGVFKWLSGEDSAVIGSLESMQTLDASTSSMLVLDSQLNVVVANKASKVLLAEIEGDIRARNGTFSASMIVGSNITAMGVQASAIQEAANKSPDGGSVSLALPSRDIKLKVTALKNIRGESTAFCVELLDNEKSMLTNAINDALNRVQAIIQFEPDGTIITANDNFCNAVGYELDEIAGQHHRIFCTQSYTSTQEYKDFWRNLAKGQVFAGEFCRIRKDGSEKG